MFFFIFLYFGTAVASAEPSKDASGGTHKEYKENDKQAALALGGIASIIYGTSENTLSPISVSEKNLQPGKWKTVLSRDWGVTGRDDLLRIFNTIETAGYSKQYAEYNTLLNAGRETPLWRLSLVFKLSPTQTRRLFFVNQTEKNIKERGLKAWDYGSLISIARWGFGAGYISETEAWERILYYSQLIHQLYNSWEDYAANYLIGRGFYYAADFERKIAEGVDAYYNLISDQHNTWSIMKWQQSANQKKEGKNTTDTLSIKNVLFETPAELQAWDSFIDGWTSYTFGDVSGAAENYARCIEIDPAITIAHINRAQALSELKRYEEALISAAVYTELETDDPEGFRLLFSIYAKMGRSKNALKAIDTAIELSISALPQNPSFYGYTADKGVYLTETQEYKKALPLLLEAAGMLKIPILYLYIGNCYMGIGDIPNASIYYRTAGENGIQLTSDQQRIATSSPPKTL